MRRLLQLYLELGHLSMYNQWIYTKNSVFFLFFFEKTMKAYFKAIILSIKTYENMLKFNFQMGGCGEGTLDILIVFIVFWSGNFIDVQSNEVS